MTERDITICGHGSGTPSLKRLDTYLENRFQSKMSNGVRKGLLKVRRLKALDDRGRQNFHDFYSTILGRNTYSQDLRQYVYTPYKGRYYSDCSSSGCATYQRCGVDIPLMTTADMLNSSMYTDVPVEIVDGHIMNPEELLPGDALLFAGNINRPSLRYVGHVEYIYEMPETYLSGWQETEQGWQYLERGEPVCNAWRYINGRWYVFAGDGKMVTGWFHDETDAYYYLAGDGAMCSSQWVQDGSSWYYLTVDGRMARDAYVPDPRGWCYVNHSGAWDGKYSRLVPGPGVTIVGGQEY